MLQSVIAVSDKMKNISALAPWAESVLKSLDAKSRQVLFRKIAQDLKRSNQQRIRAQKSADGANWKQRNKSRKANELDITYRDKSGTITRRKIRSVTGSKTHLHGHDYLRGAFRSFRRNRILEVHSSKTVRRKSEQKMLTGFAKRLRTATDANGCKVYLSDRDSKIARVHHYGLRERLAKRNIQYPQRSLLGVSSQDEEQISNVILQKIRPD